MLSSAICCASSSLGPGYRPHRRTGRPFLSSFPAPDREKPPRWCWQRQRPVRWSAGLC
jgi:hypothetical protein